MVYVHICDSCQIMDHKPNLYGMGTHIKYLYSRSLWVRCEALELADVSPTIKVKRGQPAM